MKTVLLAFVFSFFAIYSLAQDQIKVMSYNLLNYGNYTTYCTTTNNNITAKNNYIRPIIQYYQPDILGVVEMAANSWLIDRFLDSVMNYAVPNKYARANYSNSSSSDLISMLYFNQNKLAFAKQSRLNNYVRDVLVYSLYYKSPDLSITHDTIWLHCIVAHLKAGSATSDANDRASMVNNIMTTLPQFLPAGNFLIMGDFNVYNSSEACYQGLLNPTNTAYKFIDPINKPNWSSSYETHTQSTHTTSNGCASTGGLDDRFDFILSSQSIISGSKGAVYVNGSYKAIGNDGNHYNQAINSGTNSSVPANILTCLYENSDHLPVMMKVQLSSTGAGVENISQNGFRFWFENPTKNELVIHFESNKDESFDVLVCDLQGKVLINKQLKMNEGFAHSDFSLAPLAKGYYLVRIKGDGFFQTQKLIKL